MANVRYSMLDDGRLPRVVNGGTISIQEQPNPKDKNQNRGSQRRPASKTLASFVSDAG